MMVDLEVSGGTLLDEADNQVPSQRSSFQHVPRIGYVGKRLVDLFVLACIGVPAVAIGVIAGLAVRLTSRGPVLASRDRIGQRGRPFRLLTFRTRRHESSDVDPQLTWVGRVLRATSVDELPQLLNVLAGSMSFVGPRPDSPVAVAKYSSRQMMRLAVRPGITGFAQVTGRGDNTLARRFACDVEYVDRQCLQLDLRIIGRTLSGRRRNLGDVV